MKHIRILALILCACFVPVAWGRPQACTTYTPWAQFHRYNMRRSNPCEKVLNVNNVGNLSLKWSYATGGAVQSSPAVVNGVVYFGSLDNNVYALNASTGAKLWSYTTGGAVRSSPAVSKGVVYIGSGDFNVYALNAKTDRQRCEPASPPTVVNGVVYVGSNDNVYALNASTGALQWSYTTTGGEVDFSPAVANGVVYFG